MASDKDILKISFIKRRMALLKWFQVGCIGLLVCKLFKLQILDNFHYKKLSNRNSKRTVFLLPKRGIIYDRNNVVIANNITSTKLVYYKTGDNYMNDIKKAYSILKKRPNNYEAVLKRLDRGIKRAPKQKFVLARNLSREDIIRTKFNLVYLNGVDVEKYNIRYYPFGKATSCLVGYVIKPQNVDNAFLQLNNDHRVGSMGLEKIFEKNLSGKIGLKHHIVNVLGNKVGEILVNNPIDGKPINTTIDQRLQSKLTELMENKSGACTMLDLQTGEILAMYSSPNIDPNIMSRGIDDIEWQQLVADNGESSGMFTNKNISSAYPPGSTFKIVSTMTALLGGWDSEKKFKCTGELQIGNRIFHCWKDEKKGGHGYINLDVAIAQSCNCYFYNLSQYVDPDEVCKMAEKLGLNQKLMEDFTAEVKGFVPNKKWKKEKLHQVWFPGDSANMILGQGWITVTPLQLATMAGRLATNKEIVPQYVPGKKVKFKPLGLDESALEKTRHGLFSVINSPYGIAYGAANPKYGICGKTGSAQVVSERIENKDMRSGKVDKKKRTHALFVGFAPYDNPRYSIAVVVEHGIGGAGSALPVAARLLETALDLDAKKEKKTDEKEKPYLF